MISKNKNHKAANRKNDGRPDGDKSAPNVGTPARSIVLLQGAFAVKFFDQLEKKNLKKIFVTEGRPNLEAATVNCRELIRRKITPTLISDNMAGFLFYKNLVQEVWIAYQLFDSKGAVCDIGALILGVLGKQHHIPVYLFPSGRRKNFMGKEKDLMSFKNKMIAPRGIRAYVPLIEWLPAKYITKIYSAK